MTTWVKYSDRNFQTQYQGPIPENVFIWKGNYKDSHDFHRIQFGCWFGESLYRREGRNVNNVQNPPIWDPPVAGTSKDDDGKNTTNKTILAPSMSHSMWHDTVPFSELETEAQTAEVTAQDYAAEEWLAEPGFEPTFDLLSFSLPPLSLLFFLPASPSFLSIGFCHVAIYRVAQCTMRSPSLSPSLVPHSLAQHGVSKLLGKRSVC